MSTLVLALFVSVAMSQQEERSLCTHDIFRRRSIGLTSCLFFASNRYPKIGN